MSLQIVPVEQVFASVFKIDPTVLDETASPYSIESWDSFGHLALLDALQAAYGITFELTDIAEMDTLGRVKQVLARRGKLP